MSTSIGAYNVIFDGDSDPVVRAAKAAEGALAKYEKAVRAEDAAFVEMLGNAIAETKRFETVISASTKTQGAHAAASGRMTYAMQAFAFGIQDASSVTGGFDQQLRASSNNFIQLASLLSPLAGTVAAFAFTGLAMLVKQLDSASTATEQLADKQHRLLTEYNSAPKEIDRFRDQLEKSQDIAKIDSAKSAEDKQRALLDAVGLNDETLAKADAQIKSRMEAIGSIKDKWRKRMLGEYQDISNENATGFTENMSEKYPNVEDYMRNEHGALLPSILGKSAADEDLDTLAALQEEVDKLRDSMKKYRDENEQIKGEGGLLEQAGKRLAELKEAEQAKAADKAWADQMRQDAWEHAEAVKAQAEAQKQAARAEKDRDRIRRQSQAHTPEGRAANIMADAQQTIADIRGAGFGDAETAALIDSAITGAQLQMAGLGKAGVSAHHFAGAETFGSAGAFSRVAAATINDPTTDEMRKLVDIGKQQLDALRKQAAPQVVNF